MNARTSNRKCNVSARVDQEASATASGAFYRSAGEGFQIAGTEIFFAELNEINSRARVCLYALQQPALPLIFISRKLSAIGDVVEKHRE